MSIKSINGLKSLTTAIVGGQWGDQGKGKLVDVLAENYQVCARYNGGANAGHTVVAHGKKYAFHLLPCGILYPSCMNILGNGVVIHVQSLFQQLQQINFNNRKVGQRIKISDRAHIVTGFQIAKDSAVQNTREGLGTTKRGIGPTYSSKADRIGLRIADLQNWNTFLTKYQTLGKRYPNIKLDSETIQTQLKTLRSHADFIHNNDMVVDSVQLMNKYLTQGKRILIQGANAAMLDLDHGTYPFVTSSNTTVGGICTGLGIPPQKIETVIGIVKAYLTRVGDGPFPSQQKMRDGQILRDKGGQYGTTTGRPRRCGWIDIPAIKYANKINGFDSLNLTKLDVLDQFRQIRIGVKYLDQNSKQTERVPANIEEYSKYKMDYTVVNGWNQSIKGIKKYADLPLNAKQFIEMIESLSNVKISWIGTGPGRQDLILKE